MASELLRALFLRSTWRFAWRNAGRNPRRTGIVVTAIAVGLAGILLTMAINYGMVFQMIETAIETELGHLQVHAAGYADDPALERRIDAAERADESLLGSLPAVRSWAPRVRGEGLLFSPRASVGVRVLGVDPQREARVGTIAGSVVSGAWLDGGRRRILIGERLAERLGVGLDDKVVLSVQELSGDMTGEAYRVGGVFQTASRELDESAVFLRLDESQALFGLGDAVSEWVVLARSRADVDPLRDALAERLGPRLEVRTWRELRPMLVSMIEVFDSTGWAVYAAVFVAMAFGIANVLLMSVYERIREIGILMAIGMQPGRLVATVLLESLMLTGVGVALGLAAGVGAVLALGDGIDLSRYAEGLTSVGVGTRIVPVLRPADIWIPVAVAAVTALAASLWPALRAVRIRPAEAVRHV